MSDCDEEALSLPVPGADPHQKEDKSYGLFRRGDQKAGIRPYAPGASSAESVIRYVRSISGSGKSWTERLRLWNKTEYQVHGRLPLADMSVSSGMMWDMTSS